MYLLCSGSMMFGICGRGLRPCNFWCILHLSFGCKVLKGEKQFSSSHCLPKCAAEDCGHTRSGVHGAAELTAWLTLARQLTACSLQTRVSCRNVNLPPKVINSWARVSPLLWPFPLKLSLPAVLPGKVIHTIVSACSPHMLP